jgi:predicted transglutaminase-like cysteine proteinase
MGFRVQALRSIAGKAETMSRSFGEMIAVAATLALAPALGGAAVAMPSSAPYAFIVPANPDVFGTVALNAGMTPYDVRWRRVSGADQKDARIAEIAAATTGMDTMHKLALVQTEVNRRVTWRADLDGYGIADYWANAGETLTKGVGDSEDIAVVKMQALKAAGFSPRDIYLSVGRDSKRGADALLLVRAEGRFYVLDDRVDRPETPEEHIKFVPIITLGQGKTWLHGRNIASGAQRNRTAR